MENIKERVSYLKGLSDGLGISEDSKEGKLLIAMIDVIDEMAEAIEDINLRQDEVEDYVNAIDEDLERVEDDIYDEEDEDDCDCGCGCGSNEEGYLELECPKCGDTIYLDEDMLEDGDEEIVCPNCNEPLTLDCDCDCGCDE